MALVEAVKLTKDFGGLRAVDDLSFSVERGEIVGLIGPNGAGKTTVFNLVSGVFVPTRGEVRFEGRRISGLKPHTVANLGLVRTFQQTSLFKGLSVAENMAIGGHSKSGLTTGSIVLGFGGYRNRINAMAEANRQILRDLDLERFQNEDAGNLPYGHQKVLGVGLALASRPKVLLLDEPVAGMNAEETSRMMVLIRKIREAGITVLLVEHDMKMVMGVCDRIVAISFGSKITEGTPDHVRNHPEVIRAYLGG